MLSHVSPPSWKGSNKSDDLPKKSENVTPANVQNGQQKNGKLPVKSAEEIPWNKLCVDLIRP